MSLLRLPIGMDHATGDVPANPFLVGEPSRLHSAGAAEQLKLKRSSALGPAALAMPRRTLADVNAEITQKTAKASQKVTSISQKIATTAAQSSQKTQVMKRPRTLQEINAALPVSEGVMKHPRLIAPPLSAVGATQRAAPAKMQLQLQRLPQRTTQKRAGADPDAGSGGNISAEDVKDSAQQDLTGVLGFRNLYKGFLSDAERVARQLERMRNMNKEECEIAEMEWRAEQQQQGASATQKVAARRVTPGAPVTNRLRTLSQVNASGDNPFTASPKQSVESGGRYNLFSEQDTGVGSQQNVNQERVALLKQKQQQTAQAKQQQAQQTLELQRVAKLKARLNQSASQRVGAPAPPPRWQPQDHSDVEDQDKEGTRDSLEFYEASENENALEGYDIKAAGIPQEVPQHWLFFDRPYTEWEEQNAEKKNKLYCLLTGAIGTDIIAREYNSDGVPADGEALVQQPPHDMAGKKLLVVVAEIKLAEALCKDIAAAGVAGVDRIHGKRAQHQRRSALDRFRSGEISILISTGVITNVDLSDIPDVTGVVLASGVETAEEYAHKLSCLDDTPTNFAVIFFEYYHKSPTVAADICSLLESIPGQSVPPQLRQIADEVEQGTRKK
ncbi:unnamed protein product [Amoebophrya sp. A25]|nr:unnamed protein product [Amoebophrya sp. A25]|eukprot:GSA25T00009731001.1